MNFWETIFLFFAFQAFLFALFLFLKKKGDRLANRMLGTFLVLFSLNLVYNVLYWSKLMFTAQYVHLTGISVLIWTSYPILVFLYSRRVVTGKGLSIKDLVYCIPLILAFSSHFPFYRLGSAVKGQVLMSGRMGEYIFLSEFTIWGIVATLVFYTIWTFFSFKNRLKGIDKKRWFFWMLGSFSCYVVAMTTYFVLASLALINTGHDYFIMYTILLFIGMMTYFGIMQPEIFEGRSMDSILPFKKYQKTGLSESHSLELKKQLEIYFQTSKPYLKSDLRLTNLAAELNLSRHHTSQVINEHFDTNFFDFVNSYRIEEAKKLLLENNNLNITDVIYSSGFNNRVSFYRIFKQHTGTTPSHFKKQRVSTP